MAAMGPPGGGRNVISRRLQSRFNLINMTFPQESQIKRIFGTMIAQKLQDFDEEVKPLGDMMTKVGVVGGWGHCSVCATSPVWWCQCCSAVCCTGHSGSVQHHLHKHAAHTDQDPLPLQPQGHIQGACVEGEGQDVCDCEVCAPCVFVHMYACMHVGWVVGGSLCRVAPPPPHPRCFKVC